MARGYAGKFLDVNLTTHTLQDITFPEDILRQYLGGRALATKILWDALGTEWEQIDPLGPENILLALTGPMTGYYPGSRICLSGKSCLTNGIVGSTVAAEFPIDLKCAGYDGVIVKGRAPDPVYLYIEDKTAEIRTAKHLWGTDGKQTIKLINQEIRQDLAKRRGTERMWKEPGIIYIGPAGENCARVAAVCAKWVHGAGYGGYGGVMGSKNLKAFVAKGTGALPDVMNLEDTLAYRQRITRNCLSNDGMRRWGTGAAGYEVGAGTSSEPVKNWQEEWHDERTFGVDHFERTVWVKRYWGDYGCPTTCLKVAAVTKGQFSGAITDNPDYETQAYAGTNLGIFDPEANVYVNAKLDELGHCGIQAGNAMGFAAELFQRGILTTDDIGFALEWGDAKAFGRLAEMIAKREGIGDVLAEGAYRAAFRIKEMKGIDVLPYVVHAKGMAIGAHGTRSGLDYEPITAYATSVQGGDHTSCGGMKRSASDLNWGFADSAVICGFNVFDNDPTPMWGMLQAITGWDITAKDWDTTLGLRMLIIQRAALLVGGPDATWNPDTDDDNPPRFYEPLPSGPVKGQTTDKLKVETDKNSYYKSIGWDNRGIPTSDTLRRLGLSNLEKVFDKIR